MPMSIMSNIKRIVEESGYKHKVIAERAGYTIATFSNLLNGRKIITAEDILKFSAALNVSPNELLGYEEK